MISKELLSEVLDLLASETLVAFEIENKEVSYVTTHKNLGRQNWRTVNIHELIHKCKGWAVKKDTRLLKPL